MEVLIILAPLLLAAFSFQLFAKSLNLLSAGWRKTHSPITESAVDAIFYSFFSFSFRQNQMEAVRVLLCANSGAAARNAWLRYALAPLPAVILFLIFAGLNQLNGVFILGIGLILSLVFRSEKIRPFIWLGLTSLAVNQSMPLARFWLSLAGTHTDGVYWLMDGRWPNLLAVVGVSFVVMSWVRWEWLMLAVAPVLMAQKVIHPHLAYGLVLGSLLAPYLRAWIFERRVEIPLKRTFQILVGLQLVALPLHFLILDTMKSRLALPSEFGELLPAWWIVAVLSSICLCLLIALIWGHWASRRHGERARGLTGLHLVIRSGDLSLTSLVDLRSWLDLRDRESANLVSRYSSEDLALLPTSVRREHDLVLAERKLCHSDLQKVLLNYDFDFVDV